MFLCQTVQSAINRISDLDPLREKCTFLALICRAINRSFIYRSTPYANGPKDSAEVILKRINEGKIELDGDAWRSVSKEAKVGQMIVLYCDIFSYFGLVFLLFSHKKAKYNSFCPGK